MTGRLKTLEALVEEAAHVILELKAQNGKLLEDKKFLEAECRRYQGMLKDHSDSKTKEEKLKARLSRLVSKLERI